MERKTLVDTVADQLLNQITEGASGQKRGQCPAWPGHLLTTLLGVSGFLLTSLLSVVLSPLVS
ncbi:hypothetical protein ABIB35_000154 [Arthrobacter sp. UYP6]|uniref:hypothetical protein n=1 Tax=Arthrobacter sp. UYP6 TaxID=1756378 RepID=UPI00339B2308